MSGRLRFSRGGRTAVDDPTVVYVLDGSANLLHEDGSAPIMVPISRTRVIPDTHAGDVRFVELSPRADALYKLTTRAEVEA